MSNEKKLGNSCEVFLSEEEKRILLGEKDITAEYVHAVCTQPRIYQAKIDELQYSNDARLGTINELKQKNKELEQKNRELEVLVSKLQAKIEQLQQECFRF